MLSPEAIPHLVLESRNNQNEMNQKLPAIFALLLLASCGRPVSDEEQVSRTLHVPDLAEPSEIAAFMKKLQYLDKQTGNAPIYVIVNSSGGYVKGALDIAEMMRQLQSPVHTHTETGAHGAAGLVLIAGTPGHRTASPRQVIGGSRPVSGSSDAVDPIVASMMEELARRVESIFGGDLPVESLLGGSGEILSEEGVALGLIDRVGEGLPGSGNEVVD